MGKYTREEFLALVGGAAAGIGLGPVGLRGETIRKPGVSAAARLQELEPDLVLLNGRVYTMDQNSPRAEAFAVKFGRFVAVGSSADVANLVGPDTPVIDAEGMTVTPGFIDCHSHPSGTAELFGLSLIGVETIGEIQQQLARVAADTPDGYWVDAVGYDDTKVVDEDTGRYRPLTRWDLDEAVPDKPVRVSHRGGHINWYNSRAFELAGLGEDVEDPDGGRFFRDESGRLTGQVAAAATEAFSGIANTPTYTREQRQEALSHLTREMAAAGLTSVHDAGAGASTLQAYQDCRDAGELWVRIHHNVRAPFASLSEAGIRTGYGNEWLRLGAVKHTADGSNSGRTMRMSRPYPGTEDYGILYLSQEELNEAVEEAHRAGWQVAIHANGDVAIEMVLNAYERAQRMWPREDPRHRIEHCTLVNPTLLERIRDLGVVPAPFWTYVYFHGDKWEEFPEEFIPWMWAHRSFLDYGIPVVGASDYRPGPFEPMMAIQSMVTRTDFRGRVWGEDQRVSVDEALRITTANGAYASFEEDLKGTITPGKLADFVLLGQDPHEADPFEILEIPVVRTVVGGRTVHEL